MDQEIIYSPELDNLKKAIANKYGSAVEIGFSWLYGEKLDGVSVGVPMKIRALDGSGWWEELGYIILRRDGKEIARTRLFHFDLPQ